MRQASLFDHCAPLASAMPAIGVRLTAGNTRAISKDTLDKWLSPSDESHPPSILAVRELLWHVNWVCPVKPFTVP